MSGGSSARFGKYAVKHRGRSNAESQFRQHLREATAAGGLPLQNLVDHGRQREGRQVSGSGPTWNTKESNPRTISVSEHFVMASFGASFRSARKAPAAAASSKRCSPSLKPAANKTDRFLPTSPTQSKHISPTPFAHHCCPGRERLPTSTLSFDSRTRF